MREDDQIAQWAERVREAQPEGARALKVAPEVEDDATYDRPVTRGDCLMAPRPCPWAGCRHHLYLDVSAAGTLKVNFPDLEVWEIPETCALDVAERGQSGAGMGDGIKLEDVGAMLNVTRERVRQIEASAIYQLGKAARSGRAELAQHAADEGFGRNRPPRHLPMVEAIEDDTCDT